MKIEYAFYGTVSRKEVRYSGTSARPPVFKKYSDTAEAKSKGNREKYYYVSVVINGIEYDGICCHYSDFRKIETGREVIIAKGYSFYDDFPIAYIK